MRTNDWIHVMAGTFILSSLALGWWVSPYFFLFTAFVGANLFQFGWTKFCPLGVILRRCGVERGGGDCAAGRSRGGA